MEAAGKPRILLVEDSDTQALLATQSMAAEGWDVARAADCKAALKLAGKQHFDAVVLDYMLPDGDGLDLLDKLRAAQPGVAILFLTGQGSEEVAMQAMGRGAMDFMSKDPGFHRVLAGRVAGVLAKGGDLEDAARALPSEWSPAAPQQRAALKPLAAPPKERGSFALGEVLEGLVRNHVQGAAVFAASGEALAARLPPELDIGALGASLIGAQFATQQAMRQLPGAGPPTLLLARPDALVAAASIPGPMLVVLLLAPTVRADEALHVVGEAARKVWEAVGEA